MLTIAVNVACAGLSKAVSDGKFVVFGGDQLVPVHPLVHRKSHLGKHLDI
jgi:hypothetical protein